ncbi:MAG: RidA family protein [Gammaproteobacteria bacterium]|nr:RidA family protein [Gammaproteobacteria bacterium]
MTIERLDSGPRMSQIVIHNDTVHLAGQVAENNAGKGADEQTREILEQIDSLLVRAGSDKSKLLSVTIYLADINDFDAMNSVWDAWLDRANPPTRACVEARLAGPEFIVEMTAVAAR